MMPATVPRPRGLPAAAAVAFAVSLAACSPRLEWRELRSPEGYTVLLPGRAQVVTREIAFEGQKLPMSMTSTGVGASMFAVGVATLPPALANDAASRERLIAYFRDALVRNTAATAVVDDPAAPLRAAAASQPVRAAHGLRAQARAGANGAAARLAARWFIVDDRLYQLIALGGEGAIDTVALDTFFDSFSPTAGANPVPGAK